MIYYRISKYDSKYRINGIYQRNEWTAMSDIGRVYDGKTFTEEEYNRVEKNYVDFVLGVCDLQNIKFLSVANLENRNKLPWYNGQRLNSREIAEFVTSCLREKCWGRLVSDNFIFEAGYDYYIHIGCNLSLETMEQLARPYRLFVEGWDKI